MHHTYMTKGVCSRKMDFDIENGKIHNLRVEGGCNGNLQGIAHLVEGMDAGEAAARMKGIRCGGKPTSCPDQLATALETAIAKEAKND